MALPKEFWVPWNEIDPTLKHGGYAGELEGQYVGPRLGDNKVTMNQDMMMIFTVLRDCAAGVSMLPNGNTEGPPIRNDLEDILKAWNFIGERIMDRMTVASNRIFQWTHATPTQDTFMLRPIRFPLRNPCIHACVYHLIGCLVECAEANANAIHSRVDIQSGHRMLAPIFHMKANIVRDYFDLEIGGEISESELEQMVGPLEPKAPAIPDPGVSAARPTEDERQTHLDGVDVLQWYPKEVDWTKFAQKRAMMYIPERIFQPEGAMRTTEDVAPETPVRPAATPSGQPQA